MKKVVYNKMMKSPVRRTVGLLVLFAPLVILVISCSTEKAKWANIQYHNTTCHYNVWWNGNESLKLGREKLWTSAVDDYTAFIPPENLGSDADARSIYPDMDRAIEKGVKGIKKHSIYVKGEEHVPYIKECYLLTAYATFYKHDYVATANTAAILVSQFRGTPAGDQGAVLMARCLTQEKRYAEAEAALDQLVTDLGKGNFSRSVRERLYMAMVEATVPQEKYKKAVEYIHQAVDVSSSNRNKARLTFLLAQIYQKLDKRPVAAKYYHQVLRYSPPYVMEFNARLGEASCADLQHSDIAKLERALDDMLNDKKNEEYRDQIYYAKGEMYLGMKDAQRACDNYRRSVALATNNASQRARSSLKLAETLYDVYQDYDEAKLYYDTAMMSLRIDYPDYQKIRSRWNMLTELVSFTSVYQRQDSLLAVATMPEGERMALIMAKIDTLRMKEQEAKERALLEELQAESKAQMNTLKGDWYFYNSQTVQRGKETFRQRWGMRTLEDLWFLSNKASLSMGLPGSMEEETANDEGEVDDTLSDDQTKGKLVKGDPNDPHSPAYYLKDLPTTQAQLDSIDSLIAPALLGAGYILYDGIQNEPRALECYHRLAESYTSFPDVVQAFYMLYRIYDRQGNTPQANYYRDMVLMGFPDSDFANLIRDNEYYRELLRRDRVIEEDYTQVYESYSGHRYSRVLTLVAQADEVYPGNPALHRFHYWQALAQAAQGARADAVSTLQGIIAKAAQTDSIVPIAQAALDHLLHDSAYATSEEIADNIADKRDDPASVQVKNPDGQTVVKPSGQKEDELPEESRVYRFRQGQQHYVILIINDRSVKATELQYRIADFNTQYYANSGYKVNATLFTDTTQLLTVHRFMTEQDAMGYYRHLLQDDGPLSRYPKSDITIYAISTQNYATFYNRKDPSAYDPFFKKYYFNLK
ncbi:MAG: tetratricopeptide repeat protein [Bacteroidales bacterium]|nr:tetratricopeptide repeat protein [Bacteroidales bacterium]